MSVTQINPCPTCDEVEEVQCATFSLCVGNYTLASDGKCVSVAPRSGFRIPDGAGIPIFSDGCIVGVQAVPVCEYTPPDCCFGSEAGPGGGSVVVAVSPDICNLLERRGTEYFAGVYLQPGAGISIVGCGSARSPAIISLVPGEFGGITANSCDGITIVQGNGTQTAPLQICLPQSPAAGTHSRITQITVDPVGRVIAVRGDTGPVDPEEIEGAGGGCADNSAIPHLTWQPPSRLPVYVIAFTPIPKSLLPSWTHSIPLIGSDEAGGNAGSTVIYFDRCGVPVGYQTGVGHSQ